MPLIPPAFALSTAAKSKTFLVHFVLKSQLRAFDFAVSGDTCEHEALARHPRGAGSTHGVFSALGPTHTPYAHTLCPMHTSCEL
eukprot:1281859-Rhodomonas_salina.3